MATAKDETDGDGEGRDRKLGSRGGCSRSQCPRSLLPVEDAGVEPIANAESWSQVYSMVRTPEYPGQGEVPALSRRVPKWAPQGPKLGENRTKPARFWPKVGSNSRTIWVPKWMQTRALTNNT